jgi:hypothetical protein
LQIILLFPSGVRLSGLVLAATQESIRVVLPDTNETLELRRVGTEWISDSGERIEIEAMLADPELPPPPDTSAGGSFQ